MVAKHDFTRLTILGIPGNGLFSMDSTQLRAFTTHKQLFGKSSEDSESKNANIVRATCERFECGQILCKILYLKYVTF